MAKIGEGEISCNFLDSYNVKFKIFEEFFDVHPVFHFTLLWLLP